MDMVISTLNTKESEPPRPQAGASGFTVPA